MCNIKKITINVILRQFVKIEVNSVRKHVVTKRVTRVVRTVADGTKSISVKILAIRTHTKMQKGVLASELSAIILK